MLRSRFTSRRNFSRGDKNVGRTQKSLRHGGGRVDRLGLWLASVISFPISSLLFYCALLFLVLTVVGGLAYRAYQIDINNRALPKKLFSDLRRFIVKIPEDFGIIVAQ